MILSSTNPAQPAEERGAPETVSSSMSSTSNDLKTIIDAFTQAMQTVTASNAHLESRVQVLEQEITFKRDLKDTRCFTPSVSDGESEEEDPFPNFMQQRCEEAFEDALASVQEKLEVKTRELEELRVTYEAVLKQNKALHENENATITSILAPKYDRQIKTLKLNLKTKQEALEDLLDTNSQFEWGIAHIEADMDIRGMRDRYETLHTSDIYRMGLQPVLVELQKFADSGEQKASAIEFARSWSLLMCLLDSQNGTVEDLKKQVKTLEKKLLNDPKAASIKSLAGQYQLKKSHAKEIVEMKKQLRGLEEKLAFEREAHLHLQNAHQQFKQSHADQIVDLEHRFEDVEQKRAKEMEKARDHFGMLLKSYDIERDAHQDLKTSFQQLQESSTQQGEDINKQLAAVEEKLADETEISEKARDALKHCEARYETEQLAHQALKTSHQRLKDACTQKVEDLDKQLASVEEKLANEMKESKKTRDALKSCNAFDAIDRLKHADLKKSYQQLQESHAEKVEECENLKVLDEAQKALIDIGLRVRKKYMTENGIMEPLKSRHYQHFIDQGNEALGSWPDADQAVFTGGNWSEKEEGSMFRQIYGAYPNQYVKDPPNWDRFMVARRSFIGNSGIFSGKLAAKKDRAHKLYEILRKGGLYDSQWSWTETQLGYLIEFEYLVAQAERIRAGK